MFAVTVLAVNRLCFLCSQANIALFEARCKEKIRQFEDAGSDEEDIWDEKDVTFAPESQRRPRSAVAHAHLCLLCT